MLHLPRCPCPTALAPLPLHHCPFRNALVPLPLPHCPCPIALAPLPFPLPHCPFPITLTAIYSSPTHPPKLKGRCGHRLIGPLISAPCLLLGLSLIINTTKEKPKTHPTCNTNTVQDILSFMTRIIFYIVFASGLHSNCRSRSG